MINGLKQLKNLSIPQKLIRIIIIKLFQAKIRLGQSLGRLSKQKANEILFQNPDIKTKFELDKMTKTSRNLPLIHRKKLADELHKPYRKPKELRKIKFKSKDNIWNADLVIMPIEDGFKYILTVLDGFTRFAWAVPLKHKDGLSVSNAFKEIIKKAKRKPNKLFIDEGKEFYNSHMYSLFKFKKEDIQEKDEKGEYKNQIYSVFNFGKNPVIERFNRTLTTKLWKQFTINGNQKWLKILQPTINEYNNSTHRTINTTPNKASKNPSLVSVTNAAEAALKVDSITNETKHNNIVTKPKFKVGNRVRIFKFKNKFEKGYKGYWTKEIFKIKEVKNTIPITYRLEDLDGEKILGSFYNNELQRSWF